MTICQSGSVSLSLLPADEPDDEEPQVHVVTSDCQTRRGVRSLVDSIGVRARVYRLGAELLEGLDAGRPGCVISDVYLPDRSGLQLLGDLTARQAELPVLLVGEAIDLEFAVHAMKQGVCDLMSKPLSAPRLVESIYRAIAIGRERLELRRERRRIRRRFAELTHREHEILRMIVAGLPNKAIAHDLAISQRTVETHRNRIMGKTGANSLAELVRLTCMLEVEDGSPPSARAVRRSSCAA